MIWMPGPCEYCRRLKVLDKACRLRAYLRRLLGSPKHKEQRASYGNVCLGFRVQTRVSGLGLRAVLILKILHRLGQPAGLREEHLPNVLFL